MKIDGSCHCGKITYEAEADPGAAIICHCTDCQSLSGSAYRTVLFVDENMFSFKSGSPTVYVKTAQSGREREQTFCPVCGSPIYSTSVGEGDRTLGLRLGTVRQRDRFTPRKQYFGDSAQAWAGDLSAMERVDSVV